jgi:co-chaperonin GroES (HSP10)
MMINTSGLAPLGRAVLLAPYDATAVKGGLIELPATVKERSLMVDQRATVVEVGACAWDDEKFPRAAPGDRVIVTKFAGYMCVGPDDGKQYRLVNDNDIFARITVEEINHG